MNKAIQAFLTGMFFTLILDFFLFLGILLNYIDFYKIDLYYNILFADNQNWTIFFALCIVLGALIIYIKNYKIALGVVSFLFFLSLLTLIPAVGHTIGEAMFMKKNISMSDKKYAYRGDLYYEGRKEITFYDYDLKKVIKIKKKDLVK